MDRVVAAEAVIDPCLKTEIACLSQAGEAGVPYIGAPLERKEFNSTRNIEHDASDVVCLIGYQKDDGIGNVLRFPRFPEDRSLDQPLPHFRRDELKRF